MKSEKLQYSEDLPKEKLYFKPFGFLDDLSRDIQSAQEFIDIEMYIWGSDELTKKIQFMLIKAVKRGVRVRLVVDGIGSYDWIQKEKDLLQAHGVEIKVYHPIPQLSSLFSPKLQLILSLLNKRDHTKLFIIDQKIFYTGSFNMMKLSCSWKETVVRVEDGPVIPVNKIYNLSWLSHTTFNSDLKSPKVLSTKNKKLRKHYRTQYRNQLAMAENRIWLMSPYFNPPKFLINELINASKRGVDVRLILPAQSDIIYSKWVAQKHYELLIAHGISVYEYQPQVLHAKLALIDNVCIIGTGNLNYRSFFKDVELNVILTTPESIYQVEEELIDDMVKSELIPHGHKIPFWKRWIAYGLLIFKDSF